MNRSSSAVLRWRLIFIVGVGVLLLYSALFLALLILQARLGAPETAPEPEQYLLFSMILGLLCGGIVVAGTVFGLHAGRVRPRDPVFGGLMGMALLGCGGLLLAALMGEPGDRVLLHTLSGVVFGLIGGPLIGLLIAMLIDRAPTPLTLAGVIRYAVMFLLLIGVGILSYAVEESIEAAAGRHSFGAQLAQYGTGFGGLALIWVFFRFVWKVTRD